MAEPLVTCRALSKTYVTRAGGVEALHSVDTSFDLGEITAVVGSSGSGKSTLLRALAGLDRPSAGHLVVGGRELAGAAPGELRRHRRDVATYVNQKAADNLVPHLTLVEQSGGSSPLVGEFGLAARRGSRPAELSGGEQARAAFALALARGTPLLVADEPTAELDRGSVGPLLEAIRAHAGAGVAFVIATHDPDVIAVADRVLRLDRGRVVAPGEEPIRSSLAPAGGDGEPVADVRGLSKSYRRGPNEIHALRGATLELRRGEVAVLLGRSGSGKSTLLTLLAGWQAPDTGEIRYALGSAGPAELPWAELGYLPQRFGLLPELCVRENVEHPARLDGTLAARGAAVEDLLERLGLAELADRLPQETSIGQQQRTALARALLLGPDVLLADEPTSHQDARWRDRVWQLLAERAGAGMSCLIATHEEDAASFATRVFRIDGGVVGPG